MANEIQVRWTSGKTLYFQVRTSVGTIWNGSAFVAYATADIATYNVSMTEQGSASGYYAGTMPVGITTAGVYQICVFERLGVSVAETDTTVGLDTDFEWSGTAKVGVPNYMPEKIRKNTALANFTFFMALTDGTPATGITVAGTVSLDGAAFASLTNSVSEISNGWYKVNLAAADVNGDTIALKFSGTGCQQRNITVVSQS